MHPVTFLSRGRVRRLLWPAGLLLIYICLLAQQTRNALPMSAQCWSIVYNAGPAPVCGSPRLYLSTTCLLGSRRRGGGGAGAVVEAACLESRRSRVLVPLWHPNFKETKCFFPAHAERLNIVGNLRDREVVCSGSDRQGSNFELCFLRTVSSHSSHHHQEVLLAQFNLHVHKGGQKPYSLHLLGSDFNTCSAFNTTSDESIYLHVAQQVIKSELDWQQNNTEQNRFA